MAETQSQNIGLHSTKLNGKNNRKTNELAHLKERFIASDDYNSVSNTLTITYV